MKWSGQMKHSRDIVQRQDCGQYQHFQVHRLRVKPLLALGFDGRHQQQELLVVHSIRSRDAAQQHQMLPDAMPVAREG